jgi:nucleoid-associated protein YgaU
MKKKYRIRSRIRFTMFLTVAILMIISITGTLIGANNAESLTKPVYSEIIIQSGDTLWNLAQEFGPDGKDIRKVVHEICRINNISADSIYPGQAILIPAYI